MKVAREAWSVSGKPGEGGDRKAEQESVREMWHKKCHSLAGGEAGSDNTQTPREARRGREGHWIGRRAGQLSGGGMGHSRLLMGVKRQGSRGSEADCVWRNVALQGAGKCSNWRRKWGPLSILVPSPFVSHASFFFFFFQF